MSLFSKATGSSPKILLKMNSFTDIFSKISEHIPNFAIYETAFLKNTFFERFYSVGIYLFRYNGINKYNVQS